jgi:hypothetical protein
METAAHSHPPEASRQGSAPWLILALMILAAPLFLGMPLTNDAVFFDLQTRLFSQGNVPYRDILEPNWPGVFWVHQLVRGCCGRSSEALRAFDLICLVYCCGMSRQLAIRSGASHRGANWLVLAFTAFYLGCTEWCHCQRDFWLLAPILTATWLRLFRVGRAMSPVAYILLAISEGATWGAAVWLKPYSGLVALTAGITSWPLIPRGRKTLDVVATILGGTAGLFSGYLWLRQTGALSSWLETMRIWNPRYLSAGRENWTWPRFRNMALRMQPWYGLHLLAIPIAARIFATFVRTLRRPPGHASSDSSFDQATLRQGTTAMLASVYVATMVHVFVFQHLFDYVHAPGVLLALVVVGTWLAQPERSSNWKFAVLLFGGLAALYSPLIKPERLQLWGDCVQQPSSAKLQDRLALLANPQRIHIERVAQFLHEQHAGPREVLAYNSDLVSLYELQNGRPPTRFVYVHELLTYFPNQRKEILADVQNSNPRFVVTDLVGCGMSYRDAMEIGPDGPNAPPPRYQARKRQTFPWTYPVVFRSGAYLVHEAPAHPGKRTPQ